MRFQRASLLATVATSTARGQFRLGAKRDLTRINFNLGPIRYK